jgi:acyl-CoA synthetase (AMP-forming)/AMP-acid ligase II
MSLYGLLTARCKQAPDSIAIAAPGRRPLRYAALRSRLDSLVSQLHSIGVGPGDPVAVAVDDGPEAAVAFLGAACAGTCAPLDPRFTPREVELCVRTLGARAVIVPAGRDSPFADVARASGIALLELSADPEEEAGTFRLNLTQAGRHVGVRTRVPAADDVALAINTSGTTGRSKLVPLTHANVSAAAQRVRDALDLTSDDRYLNVTPLFYSQGIMLTISSILAGGTVICTSGFDAARFFEWLEECRPTWYSAAPAVHQAIVAEARSDHRRGGYRFRLIRTAAGPLPARLREELEDTFSLPSSRRMG